MSQENVEIVRASWDAWSRRDMAELRPEEFIDAGDEVIVRIRQGGRGHSSAVDVEMPMFWQVYRFRGVRAVRVEVYREEAEALAAVGLADEDGAA